jgi:nucleoside-diphosphate-sugar epimerase
MKIIIFGATGMVGQGVLRECILDASIKSILVIGRSSIRTVFADYTNSKIKEIITKDFSQLPQFKSDLQNSDACFFCLGVSSNGLSEEQYKKITYDLTMSAANALVQSSPQMTFIYVSGQSTDSSEKGRMMWARIKGKTENDLLKLPFKAKFMFRPGYIQPMNGEVSKVAWYKYVYAITTPIYPLVKNLAPNLVTSTDRIGRAMIVAAKTGAQKSILGNAEINELGQCTTRKMQT